MSSSEVLDALFYLLANSSKWSALPHDFSPEGTVRDYYHQWRRSGVWERIHHVRQQAGKEPEPGAGRIDCKCAIAA
jgi:transposase